MQLKRGFTLVELMVTIAVIFIIAMIAAPSMSNIVAKQRLNTVTKDLAYTFGQARSQSASLRKQVIVSLTEGSNSPTHYYWVSPHEEILLESELSQVTFLPTGLAVNQMKLINNPNFDPSKTEDASTNPEKIAQIIPLKFTVSWCDKKQKVKYQKVVSISKTGLIENIENNSKTVVINKETGECT